GAGAPAFRTTLQNIGADGLGLGRTTGFARAHGADITRAQAFEQALDLSGLAYALTAFEGDEAGRAVVRRVEHMPPDWLVWFLLGQATAGGKGLGAGVWERAPRVCHWGEFDWGSLPAIRA